MLAVVVSLAAVGIVAVAVVLFDGSCAAALASV